MIDCDGPGPTLIGGASGRVFCVLGSAPSPPRAKVDTSGYHPVRWFGHRLGTKARTHGGRRFPGGTPPLCVCVCRCPIPPPYSRLSVRYAVRDGGDPVVHGVATPLTRCHGHHCGRVSPRSLRVAPIRVGPTFRGVLPPHPIDTVKGIRSSHFVPVSGKGYPMSSGKPVFELPCPH